MNWKKSLSVLAASALGLAALLGIATFYGAKAQTATPEAQTTTVPDAGSLAQPGAGRELHKGGFRGGVTDESLAAALGISVDELDTAYQAAQDKALAQAVADGLITQAQADALKANGEAFPIGRGEGWLSQNGIDYDAYLAEALGISTDALQTARAAAYNATIDQAVTGGTLTQEQADLLKGEYALRNNDQFQSAMQSAYAAAVNQAVSDGVITQAQADAILANNGGKWLQGPGGFGGGHGGRGGRGGFGPGASGSLDAPAAPSAPATNPSGNGF